MAEQTLPHSVISRAISKAELSVKMQRDFLLKEHAGEVQARKLLSRKKKYIMSIGLLWRLLHFLNGDRNSKIRKTELTDSELLAAENQALASCENIANLELNSDVARQLRKEICENLDKRELSLDATQMQFVRAFNPGAFDSKLQKAAAAGQSDTNREGDTASQ